MVQCAQFGMDSGTPVDEHGAWFHAAATGISRAQMETRAYEIPHPERYVLCFQRLGAS
jgi:hypothetical protein